ncbi:MAG: alpha/beta hydrolase [Rickettsiales bacterium]|nr:alpha/beta hydrolase [Rickettsiales bacterium]
MHYAALLKSIKAPLRSVICMAGLLLTTGCVALLNASVPSDGYHVVTNVPYGNHARQTLDIYVPSAANGSANVLVFYYGGSWQWGSKEDYKFVGEAFASLGYVTVIADYRLYPEVYFPTFVEDSAAALVWVHQHISEYGGDAKNLFVSGHSAGAFNAVMLSVNPAYLKQAGGDVSMIRGTLGIAGPYDFLPFTDPDIIALFSKTPDAQTQPITYATHKTTPIFLATGNEDTTVYVKNSVNLSKALTDHGTVVELKRYDDVAHIGIVLSLASGFRGKAPLRADMDAFMKRTAQH